MDLQISTADSRTLFTVFFKIGLILWLFTANFTDILTLCVELYNSIILNVSVYKH